MGMESQVLHPDSYKQESVFECLSALMAAHIFSFQNGLLI